MDAVLRNIWVRMCCCCRLPANKIQTANTGGSIQRLLKMNIITLHNSSQVQVKFVFGNKFLYISFFIYIYNEWDWTYRRICRCLFTLFRPCDVTGLSKSTQFLLEFALHLLSLVYILCSAPTLPDPCTTRNSYIYCIIPCQFQQPSLLESQSCLQLLNVIMYAVTFR